MALRVSHQNDVKIYTVASSTKTALPDWLAQARRKQLRFDPNWAQRVELIQDFAFPEASMKLKATRDGEFVIASGTYKPQIRVYELSQASMKFERHSDAENVQFEILSDDWTKFAMLQVDRTVELHSQHGTHYKTRIPKFGRDIKYDYPSCDLLIAASGDEVYRLNLDQGRFMKSLVTESTDGVNVLDINPANHLWGFGCADACVEFWDPRTRNRLGRLNCGKDVLSQYGGSRDSLNQFPEVSAIKFFNDGLQYAVGTKTGQVLVYDLRNSKPILIKDHQYEYPIKKLELHEASHNVISADTKVVKIWNKDSGKLFTSIEPESDINDLLTFRNSGLMMTANEGTHMNIFYCPALGPAPKWCSFLDNLTEELEETVSGATANMWDDYKFVSRSELSKLGLNHLIGSKVLKAYMHGFFIDLRLYEKARAVANPFEYQEYRKRLIKEKLQAEQQSRIAVTKKLPKVNREVAEKILDKSENDGLEASNALGDNRFADMFTNPDFQVDAEDPEYTKFHTAGKSGKSKDTKKQLLEHTEDFQAVHESESELEGQVSDDESLYGEIESDNSEELLSSKVIQQRKVKPKQAREKAPERNVKMFEVKSSADSWEKLIDRNRKSGKFLAQRKRMSFADRLESESHKQDKDLAVKRSTSGAMSLTFKPKSSGKPNSRPASRDGKR